ncbi:MAG: thiamine phosphate synthase [Polyangiaceae bacterium]
MIVLITDPCKSDAELAKIATAACRAIPPGNFAVLFRDKVHDVYAVLDVTQKLEKIIHDHGQLFFLTRRHLRIAWEIRTDGVHMNDEKPTSLSRASLLPGPKVLLSMPAHSDDDVAHAITNDVDWIFVSPIFATPNKGQPRGLDAIRNGAKIKGDLQIIALGGIDASNTRSCMEAGADGVAVIRAILDAPDPFDAARGLWDVVLASKQR